MSYASDHRAWQQRVNKEAGRAKLFTETYVPIIEDSNSPMKGLADKYSSKYSFADPNAIAKYDLKNTINEMEVTLKSKAKRKLEYLKSCSNQPNDSNASTNYQTTSRNMFAPNTVSSNGLKLNASHKQGELRAMLAQVDCMDAFATDRYPRPKNFFHQAYLAKSKIDNISQSSKMSRSRSYKQMKAHYPPGHPKASNLSNKGLSKLPAIKSKRFNEDATSEYSKYSRRSSAPRLHAVQAFVPQNKVPSKANNYDTSHLSQKSGRVENLKNTLINSIEQMNDKEVNVLRSAVDSVKNHELRSRQVRV
jgi:hypothetical protein